MRKLLLEEKGSALILVLLTVTIFIILGTFILNTTTNGAFKTEYRESKVQANYLAEKGNDYLVQFIKQTTFSMVDYNQVTFEVAFTTVVADYLLTGKTFNSSNGNGTYTVRITNYEFVDPTNPNDLRLSVFVESTGNVGSESVQINTELLLNPLTSELFKNALTAYDPCVEGADCTPRPKGTGNIFIHGPVAIKGDVYTDGRLVNKWKGVIGEFKDWINADFPSMQPYDGDPDNIATLTIKAPPAGEGNIYELVSDNINYHQNIEYETFESTHNRITVITDVFSLGYAPLVNEIPETTTYAPVNIAWHELNYKFGCDATADCVYTQPFNKNNPRTFVDTLETYKGKRVFSGKKHGNDSVSPYETIIQNNNTFTHFSSYDDVYFRGKKNEYSTIKFEKVTGLDTYGLYVGGDLIIGDSSVQSYDRTHYEKLIVDGPIYVKGRLIIRGANVKFNSTIYVECDQVTDGDICVDVKYSQLEGVNTGTSETFVAIFTKGKMNMFKLTEPEISNKPYTNDVTRLRGVFYSERLLEIFGVDARLQVEGSLAGQRVGLSTTKGDVYTSTPPSNYFEVRGYYFPEGQKKYLDTSTGLYVEHYPPSTSRLTINYKPELLNNLPPGFPRTGRFEVRIIDRDIVN